MKAILEFNLPDDQQEFDCARLGSAYRYAMDEFYANSIRARIKHGDLSDEIREFLEQIKDEWLDVTSDCGQF